MIRSLARGSSGRISVGFAGATYFHPSVPRLIRAYRKLYPGVMVSPLQSNTPQLVAALHEGSTDLAFVRPPLTDVEGITVQPFVDELC